MTDRANKLPVPAPSDLPQLPFLGCGYLGATYAVCFAELGCQVLGVDTDATRIAKLAQGQLPFHEPELDSLLESNLHSGRLRFTTDYRSAADFGDVHFVCVGTPQRPGTDDADLSYVDAAVRELAHHPSKPALIVGKSTVSVGTAARLARLVEETVPPGVRAEVAWSPEFLQEGRAVEDVLRPHRIVFGVDGEWAETMLRAAHARLLELAEVEGREVPVVVTDLPTAELTKVAANAFLATKVSFINAVAEVCEATGADIAHLTRGISLDPRIGGHFLKAGLGFGGGCLPKDIRAFRTRAEQVGAGPALRFLGEVDEINERRRARVLELAVQLLAGRDAAARATAGRPLMGARICVWGSTFKPDSDDVRDSPALDVVGRLLGAGAEVTVYDPRGMENARREVPQALYATSADEAVTGADLLCVLTEWQEFCSADPARVARLVAGCRVVDGRNCLDATRWLGAGWEYRGMGRLSAARPP
ncbi:UDP-glucose dehydrogenase family protein [Streptomyces sp. NBC_00344]|uniref:UDP-glucose dehydrogenase family protein n=1 Tax=Streptomyces sp. NBC_00344 TaxID=2975720 RepID=UPI002E238B72